MKKRIAVALLWFVSIWYTWALLAHFTGLSELAGPVLGATAAALFAGDPLHRIWAYAAQRTSAADLPAGARQTS